VEYGPVVPNYKLRDTNYVNRGCQAPFIPLSININGASSYTICKNNSINLNASTSNIGYSSIQWSSANGSFSAPNSFTTSFTPTSNFTGSTWVYCTIFKPCGTGFNSAKDSVLIVVRDTVHIVTSINPSSTICSNQTATLSVNITNTASAGTYSIQWLPSNSTNSFITTNTPGTYTVKVSNFCGTVSKTLNLNAVPVPSITIIAPTTTTFCNGNTATIIANSNLTNYTWSTGATNTSSITVNSSGNYSVSVSNSCGTASAAISINYINTPTISITQTPSVVCNGQTYTITANTNASNISWSNGSTSTSFTNNTSAIYTVTASNACGSATASIQVQVNNIPPLQLSTSKDTLCLNDSAIINVTGGNGVYLWNNGVSSNSLIAHSTGWYIVSSTTTCGVLKDSIYIFADNTNIHTSITDTAGFIGTEIGVICNGCNPNSTIWSFGDGSTSTFTFITHSYTQAGYYPVIVKTTTPAGCLLSDTLYVRIYDEVIFEVPNVFTPNGDNVNDYFFVRTRFIKELNGQIFNRWGNLMFEFQSVNDQWDGKNKEGIEASDGTYYYMFKAKDITNKIHEKKGFLQLLH
jgi:gliding motility-associated-like protein